LIADLAGLLFGADLKLAYCRMPTSSPAAFLRHRSGSLSRSSQGQIWSGNFLRVFGEVESISGKLQ
jgi:hypothetical protein